MQTPEQVVDGFLDWDTRNQLARLTREARDAVADSKRRTCGKCECWMKSSLCPQEHNVKGMSRGPSSSSVLALSCPKFERSARANETTERLEREAEITANARSFSDLPNR